jgi:hypothetical protein
VNPGCILLASPASLPKHSPVTFIVRKGLDVLKGVAEVGQVVDLRQKPLKPPPRVFPPRACKKVIYGSKEPPL